MEPIFKLALSLFVLLVWPWSVVAQEGVCSKRQLPVFVTEKDGNMVTTLTSSDFKVENRGAPISVLAWNHDARPHRMVILLDVSGSMRGMGPRLWPAVMALARHASRAGGENDHLALVLFAGHVLERVSFSQGREAVQHRLVEVTNDPLFPSTGKANDSAIYDALEEEVRVLENPTSADSFLLITDGIDEGSKSKPDEILELLSSSTIRLFAILVDPAPGRQGEIRPSMFAFEKFIQKSGGKAFGPIDAAEFRLSAKTAESRKAMDEKLDQFYQDIFENYVLTVQVPFAIQKPEAIQLSLTDSARQQVKKARIFFPREIGPCSGTGASQ
jgi:hypothetical protein